MLRKPTIHSNGSDPFVMLEQWSDVIAAADELKRALHAAAPNARDYYPQGPEAIHAAQREHRLLVMSLGHLIREASQMGDYLSLTIDEREARDRAQSR